MNLTITDPDTLGEISGEIHDSYFDIEDVEFDAANSVLTIPFRRWSDEEARLVGEDPPATGWRRLFATVLEKSWEAPWYRWILRIHHANSYELRDGARIGGGDFHEISYDPARNLVIVDGNLPVTIEARVQALAVQVQQTDQILGIARYSTTANTESSSNKVFPLPEGGW